MSQLTYKVTPSLLEQWRCVRLGLWKMTSERFIKDLQTKRPTTTAQSKGKAYHSLLEHGGDRYRFEQGGKVFYRVHDKELSIDWVFNERAAGPALLLHDKLRASGKPYLFETPHTTRIELEGFDVHLSMRFDLMVGLYLHEFKTMSSKPSYDYYNDLIQWKCYLMAMPQLLGVRYHFFRLNEDCSDCEYSQFDNPKPDQSELVYLVTREITDMIGYLRTWRPEVLKLLEFKEKPQVVELPTGIEDI